MLLRLRVARRRVLAGVMVTALAVLLGTLNAQAVGEKVQETGRVTDVSDGDTPWVNIAGDGTGREFLVRMNGVQAPEVRHINNPNSRNWCHGKAAKKRLETILMGKQVQLRAAHDSHVEDGRRLRNIFVKKDGRWEDVQRMMLEGGHVLWEPRPGEPVHNREYHILAEQAAAEGRNIWDTDYCDPGPFQNAQLKLWVVWDADGIDGKNLNGEYVVIKNLGAKDVTLGGWRVRDSSLDWFKFPKGTVLPAGKRLRVHVGKGRNTDNNFFFNRDVPLFPNTDQDPGLGDGAYLVDRDGDYRAWSMYPCVIDCTDPLARELTISEVLWDPEGSDTAGKEYLRIKNVGGRSISLDGYLVFSAPYSYLLWGERLEPGESLTLRVGQGQDHDQVRYWGLPRQLFSNSGDAVALMNLLDVTVDCVAWRGGVCP